MADTLTRVAGATATMTETSAPLTNAVDTRSATVRDFAQSELFERTFKEGMALVEAVR